MYNQSALVTDLLFQNKIQKDKLSAFESGDIYVNLKKEHRIARQGDHRRMKKLELKIEELHAALSHMNQMWMQVNEDVVKEKEKELAKKDKLIKQLKDQLYEALRQSDQATQKAKNKNLELYEALTQLDETQGKLKILTARINKDFTNSSIPSSMSPNHKKIPNGRVKTGRRPGACPGHEPHPRKKHEPNETVVIPAPLEYINNPNFKPTNRTIRKQLIKIDVRTIVVEYETPEFRNQKTGQRVHATFPDGVNDDVNYDSSVKAFAYLLNNGCNVSIDKTRTFMNDISDGKISLSTGAICNLSKQFSNKTQGEREQIFLEMLSAKSLHTDFTFGRMNGKQATVIICATPNQVLYQGREHKGHEGVKDSPVELYTGTIISDHDATFLNYGTRHQECLVHVERYLRSSIENEPNLKWNRQMLDWIGKSIHYWKENRDKPEDKIKVNALIREYDAIIKTAEKEYLYEPPSDYFRDGYNLYRRMGADKEDYVLFLNDMDIPPQNNLAERLGRVFKRKALQVMSFRSKEGVEYFCDGLTILQTIKSNEKNVYEGVKSRFDQKKIQCES
jgi:hypothetical protein